MKKKVRVNGSILLGVLSSIFVIILYVLGASKKVLVVFILLFGVSLGGLFISLCNHVSNYVQAKINKKPIIAELWDLRPNWSNHELANKAVKFVLYLIPFMILFYIVYMNVSFSLFGGDQGLFIDIGSKEEASAKGITALTPSSRVGEKVDASYRELKNSLVYFDVNIPKNAEKIKIGVRFKNDFPENSQGFYIGAKDKEEWHYKYIPLYLPEFYKLQNLTYITEGDTRLYILNDAKPFSSINKFMNSIPKNSIVATDIDLEQKEAILSSYEPGETVVANAIRTSATMYTYAMGSIDLDVEKFDINWYDGADPLTINVYNSKNELAGNAAIEDDGIDKNSKKIGKPQQGSLHISPIPEGVYKIQLTGTSDTIITKIKINQKKLVFEGNILLADNELYQLTKKPAILYLKNNRKNDLIFSTYHKEGLQTVTINKKRIDINVNNQQFSYTITPSKEFYEIRTTNNDLTIKTINYLSFSKDSYFEPFEYKVISRDNFDYIKDNADYILTNYKEPLNENGWLTNYAEFSASDLFIKDKKLNIILNAKHLGDPNYENYFIPVDWIDVTVETKGILS